MKHVTLYFTTPKKFNLFSRIIRWRLRTDYSHVAMAIEIKKIGMTRIYQASNGDVNTVWLGNFLNKNKVIKRTVVQLEELYYYDMVKYMERQTGKKYSIWGAIASTFKMLRLIGLGKDGDNQFICSEFCLRGLEEAGFKFDIPARKHDDYVDPLIFEKALAKLGFDIKEVKNGLDNIT